MFWNSPWAGCKILDHAVAMANTNHATGDACRAPHTPVVCNSPQSGCKVLKQAVAMASTSYEK